MKEFEKLKAEYDATPIPQELNDRIQQGMRQGRRRRVLRICRRSLGTAAACLVVTVGVLNVSPPVAAAAADLPVLGPLFQVLTVRAYDQSEDGIDYHVSAPGVISDSELAQRVNQEIQERVDALTARAQQDWEDYREVFFATGGTQEQWDEREMDVIVDYEIKSQSENAVSFTVDFGEAWVTAAQERYCYNLDLAENRDITLRDLLGDAWVERCNQVVQSYIAAHTDEHGYTLFFDPEAGGFTTVDENTRFYIRADGVPVLVFQEYTIAAGSAGIVEIPVEDTQT